MNNVTSSLNAPFDYLSKICKNLCSSYLDQVLNQKVIIDEFLYSISLRIEQNWIMLSDTRHLVGQRWWDFEREPKDREHIPYQTVRTNWFWQCSCRKLGQFEYEDAPITMASIIFTMLFHNLEFVFTETNSFLSFSSFFFFFLFINSSTPWPLI